MHSTLFWYSAGQLQHPVASQECNKAKGKQAASSTTAILAKSTFHLDKATLAAAAPPLILGTKAIFFTTATRS